MRILLLSLQFFLIALTSYSQSLKCTFTHYSSENGLSQNTRMDMLQDRKGIMWFATWDGINKFDGYTFQTFKARQGDLISLTNNRVDYIAEDIYGFIWAITYDNKVHRLDPRTETFIHVPQRGPTSELNISQMIPLANGSMWLLSVNDGAVRVATSSDSALKSQWFSPKTGLFPSSKIFKVFLDKKENEWILSNNGLGLLHRGQQRANMFFSEGPNNQKQSFYDGVENRTEIIFISDHGRIWRYNKLNGHFTLSQLGTTANLTTINLINNSEVLLGTNSDGFFLYNLLTGKSVHYSTITAAGLPSDEVLHVYVDRLKEVWLDLGGAKGVTHFNPSTGRIKQEIVSSELGSSPRSNPEFHIHEDVNGFLWIHPYGGGFSYYARKANKLVPFYNQLGSSDYRFSNKIHSAMSDRQGNLWMCTHSKGLEKILFIKSQFQMLAPSGIAGESLRNDTRALYQDRDGNLWVGTKDGTVYVYNKSMQNLGYLTQSGSISHSGPKIGGAPYFITQDHVGTIWIGTKGEGLIKVQKNGLKYRITRFRHNENDLYSLSHDNIYCVYEDHFHRLWIATYGGGINYMQEVNGKVIFINNRNNLKGYPIGRCYKARYITADYMNHVCVGTTAGMIMFNDNFRKPEDIRFTYYQRQSGVPTTLGNNDVHWIYSNKNYGTYLATFGGGLNELLSADGHTAAFKCYTIKDGLPSDVLLSIQEDKNGSIWISTECGISKFNLKSHQFENYTDHTFPFAAQFNEAASTRLQSGAMTFGTNCGIFYFIPSKTEKSNFKPYIFFSKLQINSKQITPGSVDHTSPLPVDLDYLKELKLKHNQNTITIRYAALDYKDPANIQYAYKLEGFDQEWSYVDKQRQATYTNLPKGHYTFLVKSTNSDGVWTNNIRRLEITVQPSFWETPWAYLIYFAIILVVILVVSYVLFTLYRLKNEVSVEQRIADIKLRFFTDISHELRTPLTLISGPIELILSENSLSDHVHEQLSLVKKNVDRMLRLVNQILDLRKIQNNKMHMRVSEVAIAPFVEHIKENFDILAEEHNIVYTFENKVDDQRLWIDIDKVEKIIFNLLSNAFKYTPQDRGIRVFLHDEENAIAIGVRDQGIGIPENKRDRLFKRFESLVEKNIFNLPSSGIGLSLVKQLVDMHHATITVDSKEGAGSCFTVYFKKGKEHYDSTVEFIFEDVFVSELLQEEASAQEMRNSYKSKAQESIQDLADDTKLSILIVEDNMELRYFLRNIFENNYNVLEAPNGKEGFDQAIKEIPDFIICDVMMPICDGIEMTKMVRKDIRTSHIPLILLTAKSTIDSKLQGLEIGADDYITKPFSAIYLKARVDNILERRSKLRDYYKEHLLDLSEDDGEADAGPAMSTSDRRFLDKLIELMNKNIDNGDLVVDDLVHEMAVSRSVFFKKLKTLIGLAPIEFIKEMRVKRAAQLIETGEYNMTQISYMVGINDPRYFSKCFKQRFNMTPTEYKDFVSKKGMK